MQITDVLTVTNTNVLTDVLTDVLTSIQLVSLIIVGSTYIRQEVLKTLLDCFKMLQGQVMKS